MGRAKNKKKSQPKSNAKSEPSTSNGSTSVDVYSMRLRAEPEFYEAVESINCPGSFGEPTDVSDPAVVLVLNDWKKLNDLLAWFAAGADVDSSAKLEFPSTLGKDRRSDVHRQVSSKFDTRLESFSEGYGVDRFISVVKKGCAPKREATAEQEQQVALLYRFARDAGMEISRDEIKGRIIEGQLTDELSALWQSQGVEQMALHKLCEAAAVGDIPALQKLIAAHTDVVTSLASEVRSGALPLHAAAAAGQLEAIKVLVAAGAGLEAPDARGETALQASRKSEQCEAEGLLLQLGAVDPDADLMPVVAQEEGAEEDVEAEDGAVDVDSSAGEGPVVAEVVANGHAAEAAVTVHDSAAVPLEIEAAGPAAAATVDVAGEESKAEAVQVDGEVPATSTPNVDVDLPPPGDDVQAPVTPEPSSQHIPSAPPQPQLPNGTAAVGAELQEPSSGVEGGDTSSKVDVAEAAPGPLESSNTEPVAEAVAEGGQEKGVEEGAAVAELTVKDLPVAPQAAVPSCWSSWLPASCLDTSSSSSSTSTIISTGAAVVACALTVHLVLRWMRK